MNAVNTDDLWFRREMVRRFTVAEPAADLVEANGRSNEQVHGGDVGRMVTRRKVRQPGKGGPHRLAIYFAALD